MSEQDHLAPIIGVSPAIKQAISLMERFAPTGLPILIVGATGTGKELFARHIHRRSRRRGHLVDVNCGALPHEMAESLLFGHRKGAFTGAIESVTGHLERANDGTLFLDEVLHLSSACQVKLLRALETGEVQPLGADHKRRVDFRIVAAAQEDAMRQVESAAFRHDLFQRLAGIIMSLPPLCERMEDVVPLASSFAAGRGQTLEAGSAQVLLDHEWPGNVRELRLVIERAGCLVEDGNLPPGALRDAVALGVLRGPVSDRRVAKRRSSHLDRRQRREARTVDAELLAACEACSWDAERVAEKIGIARSTVYARLKAAGISLRSVKKSSILQ